MALPMAAWRLSYTTGSWLALSGPTSLVIMMAPPPSAARLVEELWLGTLEAGTPQALVAYIADAGIDSMPHFAAFFWDATGLHGIARGSVNVVDERGAVVLDGQGAATWHEQRLDAEQTFSVLLEEAPDDAPALPLVVGAALVSTVTLTTAKDRQLRFPTQTDRGVLGKFPVLGLRPKARPVPTRAAVGEDVPPAAEESAQVVDVVDAVEPPSAPTEVVAAAPARPDDLPPVEPDEAAPEPAEAAPEPAPQPDEQAAEPGPEAHEPADAVPPLALADITELMPVEASAEAPPTVADAVPPPPEPEPPAPIRMADPAQRPAPVVVPGQFGEVEEDAGTIFSTDLAASHKPQEPEPVPQLLAAPCLQGHPNPVGARACRLCGAPVDSSRQRPLLRPVIAGVRTSLGEFVDITGPIVVGRSPDPAKGPAGAIPLRVLSPGNDISRRHLLIEAREWNVVITDLGSTNGTVVRSPGEPEFELRDGSSVQVELGTIVDLGDGVSLRIEGPGGA